MDLIRSASDAVRSFVTAPVLRPWAGRRASWLLPLVFAAVAALPVVEVVGTAVVPPGSPAALAATGVVVGAALAARHPLAGWALSGVAVLLLSAVSAPDDLLGGYDVLWPDKAWALVLFTVAWATTGRVRRTVWVASLLLVVLQQTLTPWGDGWAGMPFSLVLPAVPLALGSWLRNRRENRAAIAAERQRTAEARDAGIALAERARIAREMHDVVAHHMSLLAVRAETAPYRLPDLDPRAAAELAEVAAAARAAMGDMQQLLGVLRSDDAVATRPQPGLVDVGPLLAAARAAGTELTWQLDDVAVPEGVGLTAYRVVAQGLANAGQHAAGAPVHVVVEPAGQGVAVSVVTGPGRDHGPGSGAGIPGLAERVAVHDGTLTARPTADGGFELRAHLPVPVPAGSRG